MTFNCVSFILVKAHLEQPQVLDISGSGWSRGELQSQKSDILILADVLTKEHFDSGENTIN